MLAVASSESVFNSDELTIPQSCTPFSLLDMRFSVYPAVIALFAGIGLAIMATDDRFSDGHSSARPLNVSRQTSSQMSYTRGSRSSRTASSNEISSSSRGWAYPTPPATNQKNAGKPECVAIDVDDGDFDAFRQFACGQLAIAEGKQPSESGGYPCDTEGSSGARKLGCCNVPFIGFTNNVRIQQTAQYYKQACDTCRRWVRKGDTCSRG